MKVNEATIARIRELSKAQRLSMYELSYRDAAVYREKHHEW